MGPLPLRPRHEPHHRRRRRRAVRDPHGRPARPWQGAPLPRQRGRRTLRGVDARGDGHSARRVQRLADGADAVPGALAVVSSEREQELRKVTIGEPWRVDGPIALAEYDPGWPALFDREAKRIRGALGDRALLLEHAGSTSVPGLAAKPIIDIVLAVSDSSDEDTYLPDLEAAGYVLRIREPEWYEHRVFKGPDTNINLHVFSEGCEEIGL